MVKLWPEPVSRRTISRALRKIGFTHKNKKRDYPRLLKAGQDSGQLNGFDARETAN